MIMLNKKHKSAGSLEFDSWPESGASNVRVEESLFLLQPNMGS